VVAMRLYLRWELSHPHSLLSRLSCWRDVPLEQVSYVEEAGDPYKEEMEQCIDLIMAELRRRDVDNPYKLAYQVRVLTMLSPPPFRLTAARRPRSACMCISCIALPCALGERIPHQLMRQWWPHPGHVQSRVGPVEWLQPYTDTTIEELGAAGVKNLLAVPISFVSEHIETLEEIDMEYRELAQQSGITNWGRVPALNTNSVFIDDLAQV
jgi:hypothetical protein